MSVEERLGNCQAALQERGVKDVKFFFGSLSEKPLTKLAAEAADALEAVLAGKAKKAPPLGDSVRKTK